MTHRFGNQDFVFSGKRMCRKSVGGERERERDGDGGIPVSVTLHNKGGKCELGSRATWNDRFDLQINKLKYR